MITENLYEQYAKSWYQMTMINCKECRKGISDQADPCPHCGVPTPGVSSEEERLQREIDKWRTEEERQETLYMQAMKNTFLWFGHKKVQYHVGLANEAQSKKNELDNQLFKLRTKKYEVK